MIGKYKMHKLDFGVPFGGKENWDGCIVKAEQDCADPQASAWTVSEVHTIITDSLKNKGGIAVDYLEARTYPGPIMNAMLVYMGEEQAGGEDAAIELAKHPAFSLLNLAEKEAFKKQYKLTSGLYYKGQPDFELIMLEISKFKSIFYETKITFLSVV